MSTASHGQLRARHALSQIEAIQGQEYGHYVSYVKAIPANIRMLGMGQTLAQELSQSKDVGHRLLYDHIQDWLTIGWANSPYPKAPKLIQAIIQGSEDDMLRAQTEMMGYLEWLKKFAVAFLDKVEQPSANKDNA